MINGSGASNAASCRTTKTTRQRHLFVQPETHTHPSFKVKSAKNSCGRDPYDVSLGISRQRLGPSDFGNFDPRSLRQLRFHNISRLLKSESKHIKPWA
jgi:hypothetical protein